MNFVCHNGNFLSADEPVLYPANRAFKFGDGVFETIRVQEGRIPLASLHYARLLRGMKLLKMEIPFFEYQLTEWIIDLCQRNGCLNWGRVRLEVYREERGTGFLMEAEALQHEYSQWQERGLQLGLYPDARKSPDALSNLKSVNYLVYVMAALHAKDHGFDESLVLNTQNAIADASKANLFIVKKGSIYTPALHQGCVDGVMRHCLIDEFKNWGLAVHQEAITRESLLEADEIFLTNALYGIRWVESFQGKQFVNKMTKVLYQKMSATIWA